MVALAVLGVAVVAVFQLFSMGLRSAGRADKYTTAIFYARSLLDEAYSLPDLDKNDVSISFGGDYRGQRTIAVRSASEDGRVTLYEITATVTWPPRGMLKMTGLRTIAKHE